MTYETLIKQGQDGIVVITLNRPNVLNAINSKMIEELNYVFEEIGGDKTARVLIITGAGRAFQSGADINNLNAMNPLELLRWNKGIVRALDILQFLPQPSIAAINGYAMGGGLELSLACTLRVAAKNAKLGLPEVKLGLIPAAGGPQRLLRLIGKGKAAEILLTGDPIDAQEAERIGLINYAVEAEELLPFAKNLASKIAVNGPVAVEMAKDAIEIGESLPMREANEYTQKNQIVCFSTNDSKEGTKAFLEKRKPRFNGF